MLGTHRSARWCLLTEEKYFVCSTVKQNRNCSCDMHVNLPFYSSRIVETCVWQTRYVSTIYTLFLEVASFTGVPRYMLWPLWKFLNLAVHQPLGKKADNIFTVGFVMFGQTVLLFEKGTTHCQSFAYLSLLSNIVNLHSGDPCNFLL